MVGHNTHAIYYTDDEEMEVIKEYHRLVVKVRDLAQEWADDPHSMHSVTVLENINRQTDHLWALADHDSTDYLETTRITDTLSIFIAVLQRLRSDKEMNLSFGYGRQVEQALDELDRVVAEREQILEYAERNG